jgi:hypothetical protein
MTWMNISYPSKGQILLLAGDVLTLALITAFGFASHRTLGRAGPRLLTTFIPLILSWLLLAPHLGAFDIHRAGDPRQLWRPFWAMVLAGPMAAWMRGAWLNTAILPQFVVILGGISALALLVCRLLYLVFVRRKK